MRAVTFVEKNWELLFAFMPIVLGLLAWLGLGALTLVYVFPAPLDMDQFRPENLGESIGAGLYNGGIAVMFVCYLIWFPCLVTGLTAFALRRLWLRHQSKKTSGLQGRIKELRKKNAQD